MTQSNLYPSLMGKIGFSFFSKKYFIFKGQKWFFRLKFFSVKSGKNKFWIKKKKKK